MEKEVLNSEITEQKANDSAPFYSYRKVIKCLSDGISLYTDNIWQFTRLTSPLVALASLLAAVFASFTNHWLWIASGIWTIVFTLAYQSVVYAFVVKKCVARKELLTFADVYQFAWRKSPRMLCSLFVQWLVMMLPLLLLVPLFGWLPDSPVLMLVKAVLMFLVMLAQLIMYVPTETAIPAAMLERKSVFKDFFVGYKLGLGSWLRLFTLTVLVNIILFFAVMLIGSPMLVLNMINVSSEASVSLGDSAVLPAGYSLVRSLMAFLGVFVLTYVCTAVRFAFVYFYASTKADMKEREKNEIPMV